MQCLPIVVEISHYCLSILSGISILLMCGGFAIYYEWRLGLISLAMVPALILGMTLQVQHSD